MNGQFLTWSDIINQSTDFVTRLDNSLEKVGIINECKNLDICHVCVRIKNGDNVTYLKNNLNDIGEIICSAIVNGREILIIQLFTPLNLGSWKVWGIELPYPKLNHNYKDGLEHVEFVLEGTLNDMDELRKKVLEIMKLNDANSLEKYFYSEENPISEEDQKPNPTISIKVDGVGIKFHSISIQEVVGYK